MKWTKENEEKLKKIWKDYTDEELADLFNSTTDAINSKRRRLNLKRKEKEIHNNKIMTYNEVNEIFNNKGYTLVSKDYVNYTTKLEYICNIHKEKGIQKINLCDVLRGRGCMFCGRERTIKAKQHDDKYYEQQCNDRNFIYVDKYINNHLTYIRYICNNHKEMGIQIKPINNLKACENCPFCSTSKGEQKLFNYLNDNKIKYTSQKRFSDCKSKYTLPFDCYLDDYNILIEYDGELHYIPFYLSSISKEQAEEKFKLYQNRDQIKNEYCKAKKIPLIRIPYWEFDNMESFLNLKLKELNVIK